MIDKKRVFELTAEVERLYGRRDWEKVADEYLRLTGEKHTPNAVRKAYRRYNESGVAKIEQRKKDNLTRALIETNAREYAEKSVIADTIKAIWGKEPYHERDVRVINTQNSDKVQIYAYSDVHRGYKNDHPKMTYNNEVADERLIQIYNYIRNDALKHKYKHIYILDNGDPIEGAGLRVSQLLKITEAMTQQANGYTDMLVSCVKWLANELPGVKIDFMMVSDDNHGQLRLYNTKRDELPENMLVLITNAVKNIVDTAHEFGGLLNLTFTTADEILLTLGGDKPFNAIFAHSHQYSRSENIMNEVSLRHDCTAHLFVGGHWHQYGVKTKNVVDNGQQTLVFLPSVVGDTDFAERLHLSCYPGFCKITVDTVDRVSNAELIRLK